jgi:hypothetical protein
MVFSAEFGGIVVICFNTFHINGSLVIAIQPKAKYRLLQFVDILTKLHMFSNGDHHKYIFSES